MSTSPRSPGCPSSDDLSAATDGPIPEEIAVHLQSCAACQRDLATLHCIDGAIRSRLAPPAGLADRIRQRVSAAAAEPVAAPRWWLSPVLRLAAAVVITAAAIAVLVHMVNSGATPGGTVVRNEAIRGDGPAPAYEPVAVGARREGTEASNGSRGPQGLPRAVRHVWAVGNAVSERDRLQALLPKGSYAMEEADGNTVFTVKLTDRDLQALVDRLADDSKWQLASPDLPQPRRPGSVALTGRDVRYSMVLVDSGATER